MVLRESLRLYSPVSQTMRVAAKDDIIPVAVPYQDAKGRMRENIMLVKQYAHVTCIDCRIMLTVSRKGI